MNITKEIDQDGISELVLRVPLKQISYDAVGEPIEETNNLIGIIAGGDYSISQLIDLGYKGDQQEGMPLITFYDREGLEEACDKLGLDIWEHPLCVYCNGVIRGSFTLGERGNMCWNCESRLTSKKKRV